MTDVAERVKAAKERDEEGIDQSEPETPKSEQPEPQPEPEPAPTEPEPEEEEEAETPEPAGGMTVEQAGALEAALKAYYKRVEKALGAENVPPTCPHCEGLGFDLTGGEAAPDFQAHEQYQACSECNGWGRVWTGSHVPGQDLHDCPKCLGRGYLEKLPTPALVPNEPEQYGTPAWMGTAQPAPGQ